MKWVNYLDIPSVQSIKGVIGLAIERNREITLPYIFDKLDEVGIVGNFHRASGCMQGDFVGLHNSDEFLYKAIEAASYHLMLDWDEALDAQIDSLISAIQAAQEPDGYLRTPHTIHWLRDGRTQRAPRWSRLDQDLELYCIGHLIEAAVAHYWATGKKSLLKVATKAADLIDSLFGKCEKPMRGVDMIPEIELALIKLFRATSEERYLHLAKYFIEERGDSGGHALLGEMALDHKPLDRQDEAVGHATFAAYLYSGAVDLALLGCDLSYVEVIDNLWTDAVAKKMSVIGGFGSRHDNEGFGLAFDLPNLTAYNEICASVGWVLLCQRLFRIEPNSKYMDVLEHSLYNNLLSGVSIDGKSFFYVCPTESDCDYKFNLGWCPGEYDGPYRDAKSTRKEWLPCACCPPNLARCLPQLPSIAYAVREFEVFVNLYLGSIASLNIGDAAVHIIQTTDYPWRGDIQVQVRVTSAVRFVLKLRIPGWVRESPIFGDLYSFADKQDSFSNGQCSYALYINGQTVEEAVEERGYACIDRIWHDCDRVKLVLPMPIRRVVSHPKVEANTGMVALQRGPVLYCAESIDNGDGIRRLELSDQAEFSVSYETEMLSGLPIITGNPPLKLMLIPYFAWSNRGECEMAIWFKRINAI